MTVGAALMAASAARLVARPADLDDDDFVSRSISLAPSDARRCVAAGGGSRQCSALVSPDTLRPRDARRCREGSLARG